MQANQQLIAPIFSFKKIKNSSNKLLNKKLNTIRVDEKLATVQCKQSQSEPTVTRAQQSLPLQHSASYFEVQVLETTDDDSINIGIITKDCNNRQFAGRSLGSFGYHKGVLFLEKKKVGSNALTQKLMSHDRIGIGINCYKRTFFVVKNEEVIEEGVEIPSHWSEFYPAVGLICESEKVRFHFSNGNFQFNFERYCAMIEAQLSKELEDNSHIQSSQMYSLVHEYLSFNRYTETLSLMNKKKIQFPRLSKYSKNQGLASVLEISQKGEKDELLVPSVRNRIMSERLNEDEDSILMRRKNTQIVGEQSLLQRKISQGENFSMFPMSSGVSAEEQIKEQTEQNFDQNIQFLDYDRYEIQELIQAQKIQQALALINQKIPILLEQRYVQAYFKAHIFLKKVKDGKNKEALIYSKKQQAIFKEHYSTHCFFYNSSTATPQWKPLSTIFLALAFNTHDSNLSQGCRDLVSSKQFLTFANYINQLLLHKLGYISCSRLSYLSSHVSKVKERIQQLKGMPCGIELRL